MMSAKIEGLQTSLPPLISQNKKLSYSPLPTPVMSMNICILTLNGLQIFFVFVFMPFPEFKYIWIFIRRFLDNQIHLDICL